MQDFEQNYKIMCLLLMINLIVQIKARALIIRNRLVKVY